MGKSKVKENIDYLVSYGIDIDKRQISAVGEVNEKMFNRLLVGLTTLNKISVEPITVIMNSTGGDLYQGFAIFDLISSSTADVNIHVVGTAMSAAALVLQAGTRRTCSPNSELMIHDGSLGTLSDEPETAQRQMDHDKKLRQKMRDLITERSGSKWSARDKHFNAAEALAAGLIDEVIW